MENQEKKQLPIPALTSEQVQILMTYAKKNIPMEWGMEIVGFIEKIAIDLEKTQAS
jgi:hypothetical protein